MGLRSPMRERSAHGPVPTDTPCAVLRSPAPCSFVGRGRSPPVVLAGRPHTSAISKDESNTPTRAALAGTSYRAMCGPTSSVEGWGGVPGSPPGTTDLEGRPSHDDVRSEVSGPGSRATRALLARHQPREDPSPDRRHGGASVP